MGPTMTTTERRNGSGGAMLDRLAANMPTSPAGSRDPSSQAGL